MSNLLIENGYVLTVNINHDAFPVGYVYIEADRIVTVAEGSAPDSIRSQVDEIIDADGQIVMPGLVNAHVHLQQSLVRGLADDREVLDWVYNVAFPVYGAMTEHEVYLATLVGAVENIRSGATATTDNQTVRSHPGNFDAAFRAGQESGIRYKLARGFNERGVSEQFIETTESIMDDMTRLYETWHGQADGRLRLDFNPHDVLFITEKTLRVAHQKAQEWDIGIHLHTAETQEEIDLFCKETGMRHVEWLADREFLGPNFQMAHAVWLNEQEIEQVAASGASTVHNPVCNMFCGSGVSPVPQMLEAGIPVAMGTDGQACNNGQEMLDTFKWVMNLHKVHAMDAKALTPEQVIQMACHHGAYAFGQPDQIGSLEPGKKADVILVDMDTYRLVTPSLSMPSLLVNFGRADDVSTTIVDGQILMRDKKILVLDEEQLLSEFRQARTALLEGIGIA